MQKYSLILILLMSLSCEGLIHDNDNRYEVIDSEQEKIDLLNGVYTCLTKVYDQNYFIALGRSDDINPYRNYHFSNQGTSCTASGIFVDIPGITGNIYLHFYSAIITINRMITALNEEDDRKILGELYFLRGYCYFQLARLFGTPPIITDIDVDYFVEKPSYEEVYDFIETDLQYALELLPESYVEARIPDETPNKGTAKALLAEIYLAMAGFPVNDNAKYAQAAQLAGEVIENAEFYNYGLLDDLTNLWANSYRHNKECIFGLYFSSDKEETSNKISNDHIVFWDPKFNEGQMDIYGGYNSGFMFFNTYPNSYRKYNSYVTGSYQKIGFDTIQGSETSIVFVPYDPLTDPCNFVHGAISIKWIDRDAKISEGSVLDATNEVTLYLLRYAQTLLTYAEAKARSGDLDASCFDAVNMIRRRANKFDIYTSSRFDLPSDLSSDQFLDSVVWERAWELCTEPEGRWFDIIRLDLRNEIEENQYPEDIPFEVDNSLLNEDWYFYLIPQEDRWLNPNYSQEGD